MSILVVIGIVIVLAIIGTVFFPKGKEDEKHVNSQVLKDELNRERETEGKYPLPAWNSDGNNYARMDGSYKSSPDFFKQMYEQQKQEQKNLEQKNLEQMEQTEQSELKDQK